jgi:hypothetical protein
MSKCFWAPPDRHQPLETLFSDEDYGVKMRFSRGNPAEFFSPTNHHGGIQAERQKWLRESPENHAAILPEGIPLLEEASHVAGKWNGFVPAGKATSENLLHQLGGFWEADFLLLKPCEGGIRLVGGCLCFPSHWRLRDKLGGTMEFIHAPVPGLNAVLGPAISKFLLALKPDVASLRFNWGLTRTPELNQHPDRQLPRLDSTVALGEVWIRVEEQALIALPQSKGILFGIRIVNHRLESILSPVTVRQHFLRALRTMPESVARYKGIADARAQITTLIENRAVS